MYGKRTKILAGVLLVLIIMSTSVCASTTVAAAFLKDNGGVFFVPRPVSGVDPVSTALQYTLAGPDPAEAAQGAVSAIPAGVKLLSVRVAADQVTVDLSAETLAGGMDELKLEQIFRQISGTLKQFFPDISVNVDVEGRPMWSYLAPARQVEPRPAALAMGVGGAGVLSGRSITLSPGHGYYWVGTYWTTARPSYCGNTPEDMRNVQNARYLKIYLENDGATVRSCRDIDMTATGSGPNGQSWWTQGSYLWLQHTGYPCSIYADSGDCTTGAGSNESSDDIRARPLMSDYENTDIYLSLHTNGSSGYCVGGTCPTGTETYYDASEEHAEWGAVSQQLATTVNGGIMAAIQGHVDNIPYGAWTCHGTCVKNSNGAYGEIRIPNRAAILTELGFHDSCDRDAMLMEDPFFKSVAMWGMYKGVCDYFGVVPTQPMYAAEYVSDTIPATMTGGRTYSATVTFRNKGIVWQEARAFRLGAVDDSDPFAAGRHTLSGSIDPNNTYTFTFNMTAPRTVGDYTSDWRMVRDAYLWFGDILTKTVHVNPPDDNDPPSVPQNLVATPTGTTFIDLSWNASTDNDVVTGYNIYRGGIKIKFLTGTSYRDTGLVPGMSYTYQVSAVDASSLESGFSNSASATTIYDITPPAAPANVVAVGTTNSRIDLSWTAPWDNLTIVNYKVFRDGILVGSPAGTSYADKGLATGSSHTYQISAVDQSGNESSKSAVVIGRTIELGSTVLWSDDLEGYANQLEFEASWVDIIAPGLTWTDLRFASPSHAAEETNAAMSSAHDLPSSIAQISVGTFFEFKFYDPAGATNVRHWAQYRSYTSGGHAGSLAELVSIGCNNAQGVTTNKYSGRSANGVGGTTTQGWFTLEKLRSAGWHTMRVDIVADTTNPVAPGKALGRFSVDGVVGADEIPILWKPVTSIYLGSGLASGTAGSYFYDDIKYGIQGTVQRTSGPNAVEAPCGTVTITWKTDVDSTSRVDFGKTTAYGQYVENVTPTKNHSVVLTGLDPAATYHIKVTSAATGKTASVSADYTFNTAATSLAHLKSLPNTSISGACGLVISARLANGFYVQDINRTCGMKVLGSLNADLGSLVSVSGELETVGGERVLKNAILTPAGSGSAPIPLGMNSRAIGGAGIGPAIPGITSGIGTNNVGLLVKVWGRVTEVGTGVFWIDDGAGLNAEGGKKGLKVSAENLDLSGLTGYAVVTGISGAETISGTTYPVLRPRGDADIVKIPN